MIYVEINLERSLNNQLLVVRLAKRKKVLSFFSGDDAFAGRMLVDATVCVIVCVFAYK